MPSERNFEAQVIAAARLGGWAVFKDRATNAARACPRCGQPSKGPRNVKGWPDLVLLKDRVLFRELKVGRGRSTPEQREWATTIVAAGGDYALWTPDLWDEINFTLLGVRP